MRKYDAVAVLGRAYDFKMRRYPEHFYESLRVAAQTYHEGRAVGGIAVCGAADMKALERGQRAPTTEAEEAARYLNVDLGVPASAIYLEDQSTNTPENFGNLKAIAAAQGWRELYMPIAEGRVDRAAFLGQKICYGQCSFTMQGVESDEAFPTEAKLLGDMVCTLQDMEWGDHEFLLKPDGSSRWDELRKGHRTCEFYVSTDDVVNGIEEPFKNFHPPEFMEMYLTPPTA
jgi:hypothetical protein